MTFPGLIIFSGYVGGQLVGTDIFIATSDSLYRAVSADVLAGIPIDELRVELHATPEFATDHRQLGAKSDCGSTAVAQLGLLGSALLGLAARRRTQDALRIVAAKAVEARPRHNNHAPTSCGRAIKPSYLGLAHR